MKSYIVHWTIINADPSYAPLYFSEEFKYSSEKERALIYFSQIQPTEEKFLNEKDIIKVSYTIEELA